MLSYASQFSTALHAMSHANRISDEPPNLWDTSPITTLIIEMSRSFISAACTSRFVQSLLALISEYRLFTKLLSFNTHSALRILTVSPSKARDSHTARTRRTAIARRNTLRHGPTTHTGLHPTLSTGGDRALCSLLSGP